MVIGGGRLPTERMMMGNSLHTKKLFIFGLTVIIFFVFFFIRTASLQVVNGAYYRSVADANRTRVHVLPSHRGVIRDRNGIVLAENVASFQLLGYLRDLPTNFDEKAKLQTQVALDLGLDEQVIANRLSNAKLDEEVLIAEDIPYERALMFLANVERYPGFRVAFAEDRHYLTTDIPTLSHVLGYTGPLTEENYSELSGQGYRRFDTIGKSGVEAYYETLLRGSFGREEIEVDAQGRTLRILSRTEAQNGQDFNLSIDARLQAYVELVLQEQLKTTPTKRAGVVIMKPDNGEVLALVSTPGFDANKFTEGIDEATYSAFINDPNAPLFPRVYAGEYPSGSVIKPTFGAVGLTEGVIEAQTTFFSSGGVMLGNRFFPDWRAGGHGVTNIYHAIADSVNTYFYLLGGGNETFQGLGVERLMAGAQLFGYGQPTGIDLYGEGDGFLPSKEWKEATKGEPWYIGDTYNVSIGQGDFLVTPLQVARATAVIANGGQLITPHLLLNSSSQENKRIIEEDISKIIQDAMRRTVTAGSATSLQVVPVAVAGKTGTAQWSNSYDPHSWFTGFAPYDSPEIVITVLVEQGGKTNAAIPISSQILSWYFANR